MAEERLIALVTGASCGLEFEPVRQFAEHGDPLVIAAADAGIRQAAERMSGLCR